MALLYHKHDARNSARNYIPLGLQRRCAAALWAAVRVAEKQSTHGVDNNERLLVRLEWSVKLPDPAGGANNRQSQHRQEAAHGGGLRCPVDLDEKN